jgi:hypothetical protein
MSDPADLPESLEHIRREQAAKGQPLGATGQHPHGHYRGADDEGELACAIASDPDAGRVMIDFGKPVVWLALTPDQAITLGGLLMHHAERAARSRPEETAP